MMPQNNDPLLDMIVTQSRIKTGDQGYLNGPLAAISANQEKARPARRYVRQLRWKASDLQFLRDNLGKLSPEEIAKALGRSEDGIKVKWTRMGYDAPSRRKDELTLWKASVKLGVDIHLFMMLAERGLIPCRRLPGKTIHVMKKRAFVRWVMNPENWPYVMHVIRNPSRVKDQHLRRLIELRKERWGDVWLSPGEAAKFLGLSCSKGVNACIHRGTVKAVRFGFWWIKRSWLIDYRVARTHHTDASDCFALLAVGIGFSGEAIQRLTKRNSETLSQRTNTIKRNGRVQELVEKYNLPLLFNPKTNKVFADWRDCAYLFPKMRQAVANYLAGRMRPEDEPYLRHILKGWVHWYSNRFPSLAERYSPQSFSLTREEGITQCYKELLALGLDPFQGRPLVARAKHS